MGPEVYFWYAGAHALICAASLWLWRNRRAPGAAVIAACGFALVYDNLVLAAGHVIGQGPLLEAMSVGRYVCFVSVAPISLIAGIRIAAAARVRPLVSGPCLWAARAAIVLMLAYGAWFLLGGLTLEPACLAGSLRYTTQVAANQLCNPGQVPGAASGLPVSIIVTDILVAVIGAALWGKRAWPWLFIGSIAVFVAAKFPQADYGPLVVNASGIAWLLAFAASSARFARMPESDVDTYVSELDFNDTATFATRTLHKSDLETSPDRGR